jgi:hypothetical protein
VDPQALNERVAELGGTFYARPVEKGFAVRPNSAPRLALIFNRAGEWLRAWRGILLRPDSGGS